MKAIFWESMSPEEAVRTTADEIELVNLAFNCRADPSGEVAALRHAAEEIVQLRADNDKLAAALARQEKA